MLLVVEKYILCLIQRQCINKQVCYQLAAPIFDLLQAYSDMFRLQPLAVLSELGCSKLYTACYVTDLP